MLPGSRASWAPPAPVAGPITSRNLVPATAFSRQACSCRAGRRWVLLVRLEPRRPQGRRGCRGGRTSAGTRRESDKALIQIILSHADNRGRSVTKWRGVVDKNGRRSVHTSARFRHTPGSAGFETSSIFPGQRKTCLWQFRIPKGVHISTAASADWDFSRLECSFFGDRQSMSRSSERTDRAAPHGARSMIPNAGAHRRTAGQIRNFCGFARPSSLQSSVTRQYVTSICATVISVNCLILLVPVAGIEPATY